MLRAASLAVSALCFTLAAPVLAQPAVTGTVAGMDGRPVIGARVEVRPVLPAFEQARRDLEGTGDPAPVAATETDGAGRFALQAPAAGIWKVVVRGPGTKGAVQYSPLPLVETLELPPAVLAADAGGWTLVPSTGELAALPGGVSQTVRVVTRGGQPVAGAVVQLGEQARPAAQTDGEGRLRLLLPASGALRSRWLTPDGRQAILPLKPLAGGTERTLTLGEPVAFSGRVLDAAQRKPVPGALVWASSDPGAAVRADAEGRFRLPAPGLRRFEMEVLAPGFLLKKVSVPGPQVASGRGATLALTRAGRLQGKVVDLAGRPAPGATVIAIPGATLGKRAFDPADPVADRTVSDAQGRFELRHLRPDESYEVRAFRAGSLPAAQQATAAGPAATPRSLTLVLAPLRAGRGRVQDSAGRPVAGAQVVLRPALRPSTSPSPTSAGEPAPAADAVLVETDAKGFFQAPACPAAEVELTVRKKGFATVSLPALRVPPGTGTADLGVVTLKPGAHLAGRVVDSQNRPVPEAEVFALDRPTRGLEVDRHLKGQKPTVKTASDGGFLIENLPSGQSVHLVVRAAGFLTAIPAAVRPPAAKPLVIRLEPEAVLQGRVVEEDGDPVVGARIESRWQATLPEDSGVRAGEPVFRSARSGADGRFDLRGFPAGPVSLSVSATGFVALEDVRAQLPRPAEAGELVLTLQRGAILQGRVTTAAGEPVPAARVALDEAAAATDDDGLYWLEGAPLGRHEVLVLHPRYGRLAKPFDVQPGVNVLDAAFDPGVEIVGRAIDDGGKPVPGARVSLVPEDRSKLREQGNVTGDDGRFHISPVADGRYRLAAEAEGFSASQTTGAFEVAGQPVANLEVVLERGAVLSGRVLGLAPEDLADVAIEALGERGLTLPAWTDGRGRYEIRSLRPGDWLVRASLPGGQRQARIRLTLQRSDRELERDLEFTKRLTLSAQVLYDGEPLPGAKVSLRGQHVAADRAATTDYEGRFEINDLDADTYRLGLTESAKRIVYNDQIDLQSDQEVVLQITTSAVAGTVVSEKDGAPLAEALVTLRPVAGPDFLIGGSTKADGRFGLYRVPPGRFRIEAQAEGFVPSSQEIQIEAGQPLEGLELPAQTRPGHAGPDPPRLRPTPEARAPPGPQPGRSDPTRRNPLCGRHGNRGADQAPPRRLGASSSVPKGRPSPRQACSSRPSP